MATTAVYDVIEALLELARSIWPQDTEEGPEVLVIDGFGVTDDPTDFLMIGVDDPDSVDSPAYSGDVTQEWANANYTARDEFGDITCAALGWNGDGDQKLARDAVRSITDQLEAAIRLNPPLNLPTLLWTEFGTTLQLTQNQHDQGAEAIVVFHIKYRARI